MPGTGNTDRRCYFNPRLEAVGLTPALLDHLDHGVCIVDGQMNIVALNEEARNILDFPHELIRPGLTLETLIRFNAARGDFGDGNVEDLVAERLRLARVVEEGSFEFPQQDGSIISVTRSVLPDGGFITTYREDVGSENIQRKPQPADDDLPSETDASMPYGVVIWDDRQCCESVSNRALELLDVDDSILKPGVSRSEFLFHLVDRGDLDQDELDFVNAKFARGDVFQFDKVVPSGRIVSTDVRPRIDGGFVATLSDVTEARRHEEKLFEAKRSAEAGETAQSALLARMSHGLRRPLAGIIDMVKQLRRTELDDSQKQFADTIANSSESLLTTVEDMRELSRIETGELAWLQDNFGLTATIDEAVAAVADKADRKGLDLVTRVWPNLPDRLIGDAARLRQIVVHLLDNAIKDTETGQVLVEVSGRIDDCRVTLRICVKDTGEGMLAERLDEICKAIAQPCQLSADTESEINLGLAVANRLLILMGSSIQVDSTPGEGSRFWFDLQLEVAEDEELSPEIEPEQSCSPELSEPVQDGHKLSDSTGFRLLCTEEDQAEREAFCRHLANGPHTVKHVGNGREAVIHYIAEPDAYDIIVMDMDMPSMSGVEAAQAIRAHEKVKDLPRIPIIGLCAADSEDFQKLAKNAGIDELVAKPINIGQFLNSLESWRTDAVVKQLKQVSEEMTEAPNGSMSAELTMADIVRKFSVKASA